MEETNNNMPEDVNPESNNAPENTTPEVESHVGTDNDLPTNDQSTEQPIKCPKCDGEMTEGHVCPTAETSTDTAEDDHGMSDEPVTTMPAAADPTEPTVTEVSEKSNVLMYIIIAIVIIVIIGGIYYFFIKSSDTDDTSSSTSTTQTTDTTDTSDTSDTTSNDSTNDTITPSIPKKDNSTDSSDTTTSTSDTTNITTESKTLTDDKIGYTITYPSTWTAKVVDADYDENYPGYPNVKSYHHALFEKSDANGKYSFHVGIAKKDSDLDIWGPRTGVGGEKSEKGETIKVVNTDIQVMQSYAQGKIYEFFFNTMLQNSEKAKMINTDYELTAYLSYFPTDLTKTNDLSTSSQEYKDAKKILESITFTSK